MTGRHAVLPACDEVRALDGPFTRRILEALGTDVHGLIMRCTWDQVPHPMPHTSEIPRVGPFAWD